MFKIFNLTARLFDGYAPSHIDLLLHKIFGLLSAGTFSTAFMKPNSRKIATQS